MQEKEGAIVDNFCFEHEERTKKIQHFKLVIYVQLSVYQHGGNLDNSIYIHMPARVFQLVI